MTDSFGYGTPGAGGEVPTDNRSVGDIISDLAQDLSLLMRQELDLAKAEVKQELAKAGKAGGMLGGAGVASHLVLVFLSLALMFALGNVMDLGWSAVIVAGVWALVGGVLFVVGRQRMRQVEPKPERTVDSLKEDVEWLKSRGTSNSR